jgi:hypothetical protein
MVSKSLMNRGCGSSGPDVFWILFSEEEDDLFLYALLTDFMLRPVPNPLMDWRFATISCNTLSQVEELTNVIFGLVEYWDTSHVTHFAHTFQNQNTFNQDLSRWDVSNAITMEEMFRDAKCFNQPLETWDVSSVEDMAGMFQGATDFNQPLAKWNVSNVKWMARFLYDAVSFQNDLDSWDQSKVFSQYNMFPDHMRKKKRKYGVDTGGVMDDGVDDDGGGDGNGLVHNRLPSDESAYAALFISWSEDDDANIEF